MTGPTGSLFLYVRMWTTVTDGFSCEWEMANVQGLVCSPFFQATIRTLHIENRGYVPNGRFTFTPGGESGGAHAAHRFLNRIS